MLVTLSDISLRLCSRQILDKISFNVSRGEILTVIGPNGAGKSSLIKVILGLLQQTSGILQKEPNLKIGYMPQKVNLDPTLPLTVRRFIQAGKKVATNDITEALAKINGTHLLDKSIHVLSGGESQRVLLANAIINKPDLLILDEPGQGMDISGQQYFYELISAVRNSLQCGVILVSHDLRHVMAASDNIICMNVHVCCSGKPEEVSNDPSYLQLFGNIIRPYHHTHDHQHDGAPHDH